MIHYFDDLSEKMSLVYAMLSTTLFSYFKTEDSIINPEAQGILQNPNDKKKIDDAVQELKKDPLKRKKRLTLSDNREITISLD